MIAIKEVFQEAGIEDVRPTDSALDAMGISRRRFTQLCEGTNKTEMTLSEFEAVKAWIKSIKQIDPESILISQKSL